MKIQRLSRKVKNKERITWTLIPDTKDEEQVIRSMASANTKLVISKRPSIELAFSVKATKKIKVLIDPDEAMRAEFVGAKDALLEEKEHEEILRTIRAHALCRSLGIPIPYTLAKRFQCRCGLDFVLPYDLLCHRKLCVVLHEKDREVINRGKVILDGYKALEAKKPLPKESISFSCRCGHIFTNKRIYTKHQKICSVIAEASEEITRGKDYLARVKDEGKASKGKKERKNKSLGSRVSNTLSKRKQKRAKGIKAIVSRKSTR